MSVARFLIDTSGLARILQKEHRAAWVDFLSAGVIAVCPVVELEFLYSARSLADRLDAFAQGLGDSLAGTGAGVMVVRPGFVRTAMTDGMDDKPFATTAEAVADDVVAGLRRGAHTVWSPPQLRWVFSAMRHLPRPLWRQVAARG